MRNKQIGERIADLRIDHDMQQSELANIIGIDQSALSRIEKGHRSIREDEILCIARHFRVTTDYLLGRITEEQEKWIQKIARQIVDTDAQPSERFTTSLLPGLGDPRRDVIEKITNMDEQSVNAVKGIVDVMYNKKTEAGSHDVQ